MSEAFSCCYYSSLAAVEKSHNSHDPANTSKRSAQIAQFLLNFLLTAECNHQIQNKCDLAQYSFLNGSSLCSFLQSPVSSSLFGPNILLRTLFSNTLSLCSSLNLRHQVSHPYRTTGKIIILYVLIFMFLHSKREDKKLWTEC
jgi:hypothetical protein